MVQYNGQPMSPNTFFGTLLISDEKEERTVGILL